VRRKWLVLPLGAALATLAVVALLVWFAAEDARQAALLDARIREAQERASQASVRVNQLDQDGAPAEELLQAVLERQQALEVATRLFYEQAQRQQSWHARLRQEVRRRTGW
jgi:hypothetical protein